MSKLIDALTDMGCDMKTTMDRFLNDEDFYNECLHQVLEEDSFEKLGAALKADQIEEAFEYAHSLKGVLANLGLKPLLDQVVEIVEPLRKGELDDLLPIYEKLMEERTLLMKLAEEM